MSPTHDREVYVAAVPVAFDHIGPVTILFGPFKNADEVHQFGQKYGLTGTYSRRMAVAGKNLVKWAPDRVVPLLRMPRTRKARTEYLLENLPIILVQLTAGKPQVTGRNNLIATIKLILRRIYVDSDITVWQVSQAVVKHSASTRHAPQPA